MESRMQDTMGGAPSVPAARVAAPAHGEEAWSHTAMAAMLGAKPAS